MTGNATATTFRGFRATSHGTPPVLRYALGLVLALIVFAAAPAMLAAQDGIGLPVGERPPAVEIEDLDGAPVDLGQYIGKKPVLIQFWATWCPLCEELKPQLDAARARFGDDIEILLVAVAVNQTKRSIRRYQERHDPPGRILWDTDGRATRAFRAPTTSYVVILDAEGKVAYTGVGAEQDLVGALAGVIGEAPARR